MSLYEDTTLSIDAFLGWVIAIFLACGGWLLAVWPFWEIGAAGHAALEHFPQKIASWSDDSDWATAGLLLPIAALLILPGAFGATFPDRYGQPSAGLVPNQSWRMRALLTGGMAGLILGGSLFTRAQLGQRLGVAELGGVTWLREGKVVERRPWTTASAVQPGCLMEGKHNDRPELRYTIAFDGHEPADLSPTNGEETPAWIARVTPIDVQLRAVGKPRKGDIQAACLNAMLARLSPADAKALRALTAVDP